MSLIFDFFTNILPIGKYYVISAIKDGVCKTVVCDDINTLEPAGKRISEQGADAYFCISSIIDPEYKNKKGKKSPRQQENCADTRSLILDVEVDPENEKKYASREEALLAIAEFCELTTFPEPSVVSSGHGFHVYWSFETAIPSKTWETLGKKLKLVAGALRKKLVADPTRVADCSSLLRIPGSVNFKNTPKEVSILSIGTDTKPYHFYSKILDNLIKKHNIAQSIRKSHGNVHKVEKVNYFSIRQKCQWVQRYEEKQTEADEPTWYAELGLIKHTEVVGKTTEELAIQLSQGHPGFSTEGTLKKLRHVQEAQTGPTLCARFRELQSAWCEGCPYTHLVITPLHLSKLEAAASAPVYVEQVHQPDGSTLVLEKKLLNPPYPYYRGAQGGIYKISKDETGESENIKIYEYDLYPTRRLKDEELDNEVIELSLTLPQDGHRLIKVPSGLLIDPRGFAAELSKKGVLVHNQEAPKLVSYVIEYAKVLQKEERAQEEFVRFGWRDLDTNKPRFVMGDYVMNSDGKLHNCVCSPKLSSVKDSFSVRGDLDLWKEAFSVYKGLGYEAFQFVCILAFAPPLLALTPYNGLIYNMIGSSGSGKSTALEIASSVWGKPTCKHIQTHDNKIPMMNTLGYLQSIPIMFDEMTTIKSDDLLNLAYAVSEGRGKNRADQKGDTRVNTVNWKTIICSTSNTSLYEKLGMAKSGNNAHAYRIFEISVPKANDQHKDVIDRAKMILNNNYGLAGRIYMSYILPNVQKITEVMNDVTREVSRKFSLTTAERFWGIQIGAAAMGCRISRKLGLHDYDDDLILEHISSKMGEIRESVDSVEGDAKSLLSHYLQQHINDTIHIHNDSFSSVNSPHLRGAVIRMEHEGVGNKIVTKRAYISVPSIRDFCYQREIEYGWFMRMLTNQGIITNKKTISLGKGTPIHTTSVHAWEIDLQAKSLNLGEYSLLPIARVDESKLPDAKES